MPGQNTIIALGVAIVIFASTIAWALFEHSGRLRWKAEAQASAIMLKSCQSAAQTQNRAIEALRTKMSTLKSRAQLATATANENKAAFDREHTRLQSLIASPTADVSCDTAWSAIEDTH